MVLIMPLDGTWKICPYFENDAVLVYCEHYFNHFIFSEKETCLEELVENFSNIRGFLDQPNLPPSVIESLKLAAKKTAKEILDNKGTLDLQGRIMAEERVSVDKVSMWTILDLRKFHNQRKIYSQMAEILTFLLKWPELPEPVVTALQKYRAHKFEMLWWSRFDPLSAIGRNPESLIFIPRRFRLMSLESAAVSNSVVAFRKDVHAYHTALPCLLPYLLNTISFLEAASKMKRWTASGPKYEPWKETSHKIARGWNFFFCTRKLFGHSLFQTLL